MTLNTAARALALSQSGEDCFDSLEPEAQELAREHVRAVLRAVREPTPKMTNAVYGQDFDIYWSYEADGRPGGAEDCWRAMIDALLAE